MKDTIAPPAPPDDRTAASRTIAWMIAANKPLYPLTLWALIGADAAWRALGTAASGPLFVAVALLAGRNGFRARVALPIVGAADTAFATKLLGADAGAALFFSACGLLAVVSFGRAEATASRALVVLVFCVFVATIGLAGAALAPSPPEEAARLLTLNAYAAASLFAFIALRFSLSSQAPAALPALTRRASPSPPP